MIMMTTILYNDVINSKQKYFTTVVLLGTTPSCFRSKRVIFDKSMGMQSENSAASCRFIYDICEIMNKRWWKYTVWLEDDFKNIKGYEHIAYIEDKFHNIFLVKIE